MNEVVVALVAVVAAFLLGSIPWGLIISKVFFHTDIRQHGSGNIGTTNAMRTMGKKGGAAVFLLDFGKGLLSGVLAMLLAWNFLPGGGLEASSAVSYNLLLALTTMGCTFGHIFSPWLNFRGGKGIAVAVGALFMSFGPAGALFELAVFIVLVVITRMVSVGSIAAAAICPFVAAFLFPGEWPVVAVFGLTGAVVVWAHRGNIQRLMNGTERKIGGKKNDEQAQ